MASKGSEKGHGTMYWFTLLHIPLQSGMAKSEQSPEHYVPFLKIQIKIKSLTYS